MGILFADFAGGNWRLKKGTNADAGPGGTVPKEYQIPLAGPDTKTEETNSLRHDRTGRVSMPKGGGTFDFAISTASSAPWLDEENVVIGQVLDGFDLLDDLNQQKTFQRGGLVNAVSGSSQKDLDYTSLPVQKVKILQIKDLESSTTSLKSRSIGDFKLTREEEEAREEVLRLRGYKR